MEIFKDFTLVDWLFGLAFPVYAGIFLSPDVFIGILLAFLSYSVFGYGNN